MLTKRKKQEKWLTQAQFDALSSLEDGVVYHITDAKVNYDTEVSNRPILKTDNTTAQATSASETISGTINLHKVAKTGTYTDLLSKPTLGTAAAKDAGTQNGVADLDANGKVPFNELPLDALTGSSAPTTSTAADYVGQFYLNATNNITYQCTAITSDGATPPTYTYTWKPIDSIKSISSGGTALTPNSSGNVNIPKLTTSNLCGLVDLGDIQSANQRGLWLDNNGYLTVRKADSSFIASRSGRCVIDPTNLNNAVKAALSDANHLTMTSAEQETAKSVLGLTGVGEYVSGYFQNGTFNTAQWSANALEAKENSSNGSSLSVSNNKVNVLEDGIYKIMVASAIKYNGTGTHGLEVNRDRGGTITTSVSQLNTIGGSGNISNEALLGIRSFKAGDIISFLYYTDSATTIEISSTDATSFIVERL